MPLLIFYAHPTQGVVLNNKKINYSQNIDKFTYDLSFSVKDVLQKVRMPFRKMRQRLKRSPTDETVEPLHLILSGKETQLVGLAERIAKVGKVDQLIAYLKAQFPNAKPIKKGATNRMVVLDAKAFQLVNKVAYADLHARDHHKVTVQTASLRKDSKTRRSLINQLMPFFSRKQRDTLLKKIRTKEEIELDKDLLPSFARKMVGKYIIHRGPNCFHAALAFQSPKITRSPLINVKKEQGYHRAMINYDELWRAIKTHFYEIDPQTTPLKYGDFLVFFEMPKNRTERFPVDFRWIRHTAVHLFGGYTFSKGSKSPNTPYTIRTLAEEWKTWSRFTKNLGIKAFRRSSKKIGRKPPKQLNDWLY